MASGSEENALMACAPSMQNMPVSFPTSGIQPSQQNGCRPKRKTKIAQKPGKQDHDLCAVCSEIGQSSETTGYCFECGRTMCEMCNLNHQQISAFRDHTKVSLCIDGQSQLCAKKLEALICRDHDRMVRKYCWDCKRPVCNACLARKHHRHTIKTFAIKTEEDQRKYDALQTLIHNKMAELEAKMAQIEAIKEKHQHNYRLLEEKMNSHTENMHNQVMVQEQSLRAELNKSQEEKKTKLKRLVEKAIAAQRVMDSLMIQAQIARIRKSKMDADRTTSEMPADEVEAHHEPVMCKCCNKHVIAADSFTAEPAATEGGELVSQAASPAEPDDLESVMESYTFELEPHEDPDLTLIYVKKLSKIVGDHISNIHKEVQETKEEMASLRFEPNLAPISLGRLEIPDFQLPDYEQELGEIRELAHKLKNGSFGELSECVSLQEVSLRDSTGAMCQNPFNLSPQYPADPTCNNPFK